MYPQNLFVLDLARKFFVSCAQISEAYAVRTVMKFGCDWRKIGHKNRCMKVSERTSYFHYKAGYGFYQLTIFFQTSDGIQHRSQNPQKKDCRYL